VVVNKNRLDDGVEPAVDFSYKNISTDLVMEVEHRTNRKIGEPNTLN